MKSGSSRIDTGLWKKIKTISIYFLIVLVTLEISPFIIGSFFIQGGYNRAEIINQINVVAHSVSAEGGYLARADEDYLYEHILHPYLGFVHRQDPTYNEYGYFDGTPLTKRSDTTLNICIAGGSFAKQLLQFSGEELKNKLKHHPRFANQKINLISVALGGYKQPQQLLALNYLTSLGAEYDIVINIDGFNEVVLPWSDNHPFGIFPFFPRHWNVYSKKAFDQNFIRLVGVQTLLNEKQNELAHTFKGSLLRYSNFSLFIWKIKQQNLRSKIYESEILLRKMLESTDSELQTKGPSFDRNDTTAFFREQAKYWARCSRLINMLASESGFRYYHFLQPNQYVEGSKELTEEELANAYEEGESSYKYAVHLGYPMLKAEGESLMQEEVNFVDLSNAFVHEKSTLYQDKCCHLNKRGYDIIMELIYNELIISP